MLMIRAKKKTKSGKGDKIHVGVIKVVIDWSGMAFLRSEEELRNGASHVIL